MHATVATFEEGIRALDAVELAEIQYENLHGTPLLLRQVAADRLGHDLAGREIGVWTARDFVVGPSACLRRYSTQLDADV